MRYIIILLLLLILININNKRDKTRNRIRTELTTNRKLDEITNKQRKRMLTYTVCGLSNSELSVTTLTTTRQTTDDCDNDRYCDGFVQ